MDEPHFLFKKRFYRIQKWMEAGIEAANELSSANGNDGGFLQEKRREYGLEMQSLWNYKEKGVFDDTAIVKDFRMFEKIENPEIEQSETDIERIFREVQRGIYKREIEKIKSQRRYNHDTYPDERIKDFGSYENFGRFLKKIARFDKKDVVLDVGCGDGKECESIQPFVSKVIGTDIIPLTSNKFIFVEADAENLDNTEFPFDPTKILCLKTLPSIELWEKFFYDCSKISDLLLVSFPTKYERGNISILPEWTEYSNHLFDVNQYDRINTTHKEHELFILGESVQ